LIRFADDYLLLIVFEIKFKYARFSKSRKDIQNNRRGVCAIDRDLRPYIRAGNMISEREYLIPSRARLFLDVAWEPEVNVF
jgi:hypothetical protein